MTFDVAVIGGGVVGCAILRRLALGGAHCVLLEKGFDILSGSSKGNGGLLHTGFDAPARSIELECMQAGYREYLGIRESLNLPLIETGGLVVAWGDDDAVKLPGIVTRAHANGVADVRMVDPAELYEREPKLAPGALGAVFVPGEHVIDAWSAPLAYALQALAHGATIRRGSEVEGGEREQDHWVLATATGEITARVVVNAAGLYGDQIESIVRRPRLRIRPGKGQFVVFDKPASTLIRSIILPVRTASANTVLLARTAYGNLIAGSPAEDTQERNAPALDHDRLVHLAEQARARVPALAAHSIIGAYAGLYPATQYRDYLIDALPDRGWITACGIRSTGLTAALGIAQRVADLYARHFGALDAAAMPIATPVPNLSEDRPRRFQEPDAGEIVCHCELVTRHEIEGALAGPLPAGDLGGLQRRTRCGLGHCQGAQCSWRVAQLAAGRLADVPPAELVR